MDYRLAETVVDVSGTVDYVTDRYDANAEKALSDTATATVLVVQRADQSDDGARTLIFGHGGADQDFTVSVSPDGRLTAIGYKAEGTGGQVVAATAKTLAFVGGIAAAVAGAAAPISGVAALRDVDREPAPPKEPAAPRDPEADARKAWESGHQPEAQLLASYGTTLQKASQRLADVRGAAAQANGAKEAANELALAARLDQVVAQCQKELDRIDGLYRAWRASTKTKRTEARSYELRLCHLPLSGDTPPKLDTLSPEAKEAWKRLGVTVSLERAGRSVAPTLEPRPDESNRAVYWRIPRTVRLWVWRRDPEWKPVLDRTVEVSVVDDRSAVGYLLLKSDFFGSNAGELTFGELGAPAKIALTSKSAVAAFASALSGVPEAVAGGLDTASKAQASFTGLLDAGEERRLAALKRRVEMMNKELEAKGIAATADDFAEQKRLEQQVAMAASLEKLKPSELDQLKEELATVQTRSQLEEAERKAALDAELATIRADIARLTEEAHLAQLAQGTH